MSKNINVNPGNYKVAGRERQGEAVNQASEKGAYAQQQHEIRLRAIEAQAGPPVWETTPPNLEPEAQAEARTPEKKKRTKKKAAAKRKAAPKRKAARAPKATSRRARRPSRPSKAARRTRRARG